MPGISFWVVDSSKMNGYGTVGEIHVLQIQKTP